MWPLHSLGIVTYPIAVVLLTYRPVVPGGPEGGMATLDFDRSVDPISTKGGRLWPPNNTGTPRFSNVPTALT